jgi:hypothetical protein
VEVLIAGEQIRRAYQGGPAREHVFSVFAVEAELVGSTIEISSRG